MEATAHQLAKASHLNQQKTDGFMVALIGQRSDLQGLPYLMGDDCKMNEVQARLFRHMAGLIQEGLAQVKNKEENPSQLWEALAEFMVLDQQELPEGLQPREHLDQARTAALMQILMPESETIRIGLAKMLAMIPHRDATRALAKLAIFSPKTPSALPPS